MTDYKPKNYNSVSAYFVLDDAREFLSFLKKLFNAIVVRRYDLPDGSILHAEMKIDDTIVMFGNSSEQYPAIQQLVHIYVPDVDKTFKKALDLGCTSIDEPKTRDSDPDKRGTFKDSFGNIWSVATQLHSQ